MSKHSQAHVVSPHFFIIDIPIRMATAPVKTPGVRLACDFAFTDRQLVQMKGKAMLVTKANQPDIQSLRNLLTIEEAMAFSGYTGQYLRRMAKKGMIRAVKKGHFWLLDQQSLNEYMEAAIENRDKRFGPREEDE